MLKGPCNMGVAQCLAIWELDIHSALKCGSHKECLAMWDVLWVGNMHYNVGGAHSVPCNVGGSQSALKCGRCYGLEFPRRKSIRG